MSKPTFGSLFTGIGGFDLGLERAGWECAWQVENDPFCNRVLAKHWPGVHRYGDIRTLDYIQVEPVDLLAAGFPCPPWSRAGRRSDAKNLWPETAAAIRQLRPDWVLLENVASLLAHDYFGEILGTLASLGYDAEWECLPAAAFGAPHPRDRVFLVAYAHGLRHRLGEETVFPGRTSSELYGRWESEPGMERVADGIPSGVDRHRALGNAVVPAIAEWIGRRIRASDQVTP